MKTKIRKEFRYTWELRDGSGGALSFSGDTEDNMINVQASQPGDQRESAHSAAVRIPAEEFWALVAMLPGAPT